MAASLLQNVAIIPARGGSKGIPRKNLADLHGLPLVAWSICAALESSRIDRVVVSTDDPEIQEIALQYGAEAPFLRPPELASDSSDLGSVMAHARREMKLDPRNTQLEIILYPTSPFRPVTLVDRAIEMSLKSGQAVSLFESVAAKEETFLKVQDGKAEAVPYRGCASVVRRTGLFLVTPFGTAHPYSSYGAGILEYLRVVTTNGEKESSDILNLLTELSIDADADQLPLAPLQQLWPHHGIIESSPIVLLDIDTPQDLTLARSIPLSDLPWIPQALLQNAIKREDAKSSAVGTRRTPHSDIHSVYEQLEVFSIGEKLEVEKIGEISVDALPSPKSLKMAIRDALGDVPSSLFVSVHGGPPPTFEKLPSKPLIALGDESPLGANCWFMLKEIGQFRATVGGKDAPLFWTHGSLSWQREGEDVQLIFNGELKDFDSLFVVAVDHLTQKILISERHVFLKAKWIKFEYSNKGEIRLSVNLMPGTICKLSFEPSPRRCHLMLSWQRSGDADAEPPYIFHPVEVPQSVSYNFASRTWKNLETGAIIHGRQQAQSFSSWGGWMYLPREESDSDQWCLPEGHVS